MYKSINKGSRKRRQDSPALSTEDSSFLLLDNPAPIQPGSSNVVERAKVVQYLRKVSSQETNNPSACIKIVISDLESPFLSQDVQNTLVTDFEVESVSISSTTHQSVERIVSIYGNLVECLRCALFIAFVLNAEANNVTKTEAYTLKSQNYHIDVLLEVGDLDMERLSKKFPQNSMDFGAFERNWGLQLVTLSGDFVSIFNSLFYIYSRHAYSKYASNSEIQLLPIIGIHDGDDLYERGEANAQAMSNNKNNVLNFVYSKTFLGTQ